MLKATTFHPIVRSRPKRKIFANCLAASVIASILLPISGCGRIGFGLSEPYQPSATDTDRGVVDAESRDTSDAVVRDSTRDFKIVARDAGNDAAMDATQPTTDAVSSGSDTDGDIDTGADSDSDIDGDIDTGADSDSDAPIEDADGDVDEPQAACSELPEPIDHCLHVPYIGGPPLIEGILDGVIDCAPPLNTIEPMGWTSDEPLPEGNNARYAIGYREDGLYIFVEVTDPDRLPAPVDDDPWKGDGVEVYIDSDGDFPNAPDYDNPGAMQFIITAPEDDTTPSTRATAYRDMVEQGSWDSSRFAAFPTGTGYVLEAWFTADDLELSSWTLEAGGDIGFNISINVSTTSDDLTNPELDGTRIGQYFLHVGGDFCGEPYCSCDAFCTPELQP